MNSAPLADAMGRSIGTITIWTVRPIRAEPIAAEAARRIYVVANLTESDPFVADGVRAPNGQQLVDRMLEAFPDLVTLAMHAALPGRNNTIIASSFGRIGKPADADDDDVIARGTIRREITNDGRRLAVELPMLDARGRTIGALSTSFMIAAPGGEAAAYARAIAVRDALARRIPSLAAL